MSPAPRRRPRRRPRPLRHTAPSVFRGYRLYLMLGAVVTALYVAPLLMHAPKIPRTVTSVSGEAAASAAFVEQEIDTAKALVVLRKRPVLAALLSLWTTLMAGFGAAGLLLTIQAVRKRRLSRLFRYRPKLRRLWSLRDMWRITLVVALVVGLMPFVSLALAAWGVVSPMDVRLRNLLATLLLDGLLILLIWAFASTKAPSASAALGLSGQRMTHVLAQGFVGYAAIFPWVFGLLWLIVRMSQQLGIEPPIEPIHELLFLERRGGLVGLTVLLACVVGPVVEELFFRGVLFVAVRRHASRLVAMLASGAVFAAVHTNLMGFLPILVLGCFLADLYERTGSLYAPIAVHVFHNTLLIGMGLTVKSLL